MIIPAKIIRPITGFDGYYISNIGDVYSTRRTEYLKELVQEHHTTGYRYVNLYNNGKRTHARVHRLVGQEFIPNPNNLPMIDHIDNNKSNNYVGNLQWCDSSFNTKKAFDDGLAHNDSGYEDSQSQPVKCTNLETGEVLLFGSIRQCSAYTKQAIGTISSQCKHITKPDYRSKYKYEYQ